MVVPLVCEVEVGDLTPKQVNALGRLMRGDTTDAVAQQVGVHPRTVERWMAATEFRAALDTLKRAVLALGYTEAALSKIEMRKGL